MATQSVVEMHKIINGTPFDTFWIYWETDLTLVENSSTFSDSFNSTFYFPIEESDKIIVRTHDYVLSGQTASLVVGATTTPIPIGTYAVGDFDIIVKQTGIISSVQTSGGDKIEKRLETNVPTLSSNVIEWICDTKDLVPFYKELTGKYVSGCNYSNLRLRT